MKDADGGDLMMRTGRAYYRPAGMMAIKGDAIKPVTETASAPHPIVNTMVAENLFNSFH